MTFPTLYAIADHETAVRNGWDVPDLACAYFAGGAQLLQVRGPQVASRTLLAWCDRIIKEGEKYGARVIVNDRTDVAAMAGAAGVHLGQTDLSVSAARNILGEEALIGLSTHTPEQIDRAIREAGAVDYLAVGPVYATGTKATGYSPVGPELVTDAARRSEGRPVVAIGGMTLERAGAVIAAGATSVAVISDLLTGGDPERRVADYVRVLAGPSK